MSSERNKLPGVLMLLLSALGFLISLLVVAGVVFSLAVHQPAPMTPSELMPVASTGALAVLVGFLQLPTLIMAINSLRGEAVLIKSPALFKPASIAGLVWLGIMAFSVLAIRAQAAWFIFMPLTLLAVVIPIWWLVEFSRRRLPRSTAFREWGTLTIGLSAAPLLIMTIEIILVVLIALVVLLVLGSQPGFMEQLGQITKNLDLYQGGVDQLEKLMVELARNPVVAFALFLMVGVLAPFVEELFKPMALWFLLKRPLKEHEGFSLGLISGGAFALLESASLVSQSGLDTWVQAVVLRAGTGLLHIGLSGLVGFGLVSCWNQKRYGRAFLYLFGAAGLHGAWNSLALVSSFSATSTPAASLAEFQPTLMSFLPVAGMVLIFITVLVIVLRINKKLRQSLEIVTVDPSFPALPS